MKPQQAKGGALTDDAIAGHVSGAAWQLHAVLFNEGMQQFVQWLHDRGVTVNLVRAVLFDQVNAFFFDVAGHDSGESLAQVDGQLMGWQAAAQLQVGHVGMGRVEWTLEPFIDFQ